MVGSNRGVKPWQTRGPDKGAKDQNVDAKRVDEKATADGPNGASGAAAQSGEGAAIEDAAGSVATALSGADVQKLADDVLEAAHERKGEARTESVSARNFTRALAQSDAIAIDAGALTLGTAASGVKRFALSREQEKRLSQL